MLIVTASLIESGGVILTLITPLIAVPLTVITFYLRSLRDHQLSWHAALVRRIEQMESALRDLRAAFSEAERSYATKEEWLRECMLARESIERLREAVVRLETNVAGRLQERS